jgi:hypothetical protein
VVHASLAHRALVDPVAVTMAPATITFAVLPLILLVTWVLPIVQHTARDLLGPALLPTSSLFVWLVPLARRPDEPFVWAAFAFSLALGALAWYSTWLVHGWIVPLPTLVALVLTWLAALSLPESTPAIGTASSLLLTGHIVLALIASAAPLLLPLVVRWWLLRQARAEQRAPVVKPVPHS